jgi:NAD(P)-dependent dehydrogenase (short-subunit alcohol dehydrogenase family)
LFFIPFISNTFNQPTNESQSITMAVPPTSGYNFTKTLHNDIYTAIDPTKTDLSQPSKVVLITGAGRGIGRSIALQYAKAGVACLVLCARTASELDSVEKEIIKIGSGVRVRQTIVDVADEKSVAAVAKTVGVEEGRLDVLVNNAGSSSDWIPLAESDASSYLQTFNVNFNGTYLMLKYFLPLLVETAKKENTVVDVVNMSSIGANMTFPGASAYQISKQAVSRLTEFVALEYGKLGVNCVATHPGGVLTELSKDNVYIRDCKSEDFRLM